MLFKSAVFGKQGVLKGKADAAEHNQFYKRAKNLAQLMDSTNILFETANALELTKIVPPNSVDYIFTDPPYGGAVQYFELSTLWASWLGLEFGLRGRDHDQQPAEEGFRILPQNAQVGLPRNVSGAEAEPIPDRDVSQHRDRGVEFHHQGSGPQRF